MNKLIFFTLVLAASGCYNRLADINMISNRNIDNSKDYVELRREVIAKSRLKRKDALESAIDKATEQVEGGEYLMNVKIYVKGNGKKVKIVGDVWGIK